MLNIVKKTVCLVLSVFVLMSSVPYESAEVKQETKTVKMEKISSTPAKIREVKTMIKSSGMMLPVISEEEIELLALVTMAEAEGETELGKRLVISTILNRVDHERFPDTIKDVIYQPNQFTSMWNGRVDKCFIDEEIVRLVKEEVNSRTNSETIYFHADRYSDYGNPMFAEGNHYFSSYE